MFVKMWSPLRIFKSESLVKTGNLKFQLSSQVIFTHTIIFRITGAENTEYIFREQFATWKNFTFNIFSIPSIIIIHFLGISLCYSSRYFAGTLYY